MQIARQHQVCAKQHLPPWGVKSLLPDTKAAALDASLSLITTRLSEQGALLLQASQRGAQIPACQQTD